MTPDTVVTIPAIEVMYVSGEPGRPIPEQAPSAFAKLEAALPSLRGRRFYGVISGDEYRACVAIGPEDGPGASPHPVWTIPGGRYARRKIADFMQDIPLIGATFDELKRRPDLDPTRPCIEYYRSQRELLAMVPVL